MKRDERSIYLSAQYIIHIGSIAVKDEAYIQLLCPPSLQWLVDKLLGSPKRAQEVARGTSSILCAT
jgi:hypothetical protein